MQKTYNSIQKRGVTDQRADHPSGVPDFLLWVDTIYKVVLTQLKFNVINSLKDREKIFFDESKLQDTAIQLTKHLLAKNSRGEFIYLKDFFIKFGTTPLERKTHLKGIIHLRQIVENFLGET